MARLSTVESHGTATLSALNTGLKPQERDSSANTFWLTVALQAVGLVIYGRLELAEPTSQLVGIGLCAALPSIPVIFQLVRGISPKLNAASSPEAPRDKKTEQLLPRDLEMAVHRSAVRATNTLRRELQDGTAYRGLTRSFSGARR